MSTLSVKSANIPAPAALPWSLGQRIAFRFVFTYFVLYAIPTGGRVSFLAAIPRASITMPFFRDLWHAVVPWTAFHVLRWGTISTALTGSGDKAFDYAQAFLFLIMAAVITLIWSAVDRKRRDYSALYGWAWVGVRYLLAISMLDYGFWKVIPTQFVPPPLTRLVEPLGNFSPMGLLWTFMGYSRPYTMISGAIEVAAGLLLLFRRTTSLGAFLSAIALTNVVLLNFCYDVTVKLYSAHLFLLAVFLLAPELKAFADFFIRRRAAVPTAVQAPIPHRRWARIVGASLKALCIAWVLWSDASDSWATYQKYVLHPAAPPIDGYYAVERYSQNNQLLSPDERNRWQVVAADDLSGFAIRTGDDSWERFRMRVDRSQRTIPLVTFPPATVYGTLSWSAPTSGEVALDGTILHNRVSILLRKIGTPPFLLTSRGFHWIQERPFNR